MNVLIVMPLAEQRGGAELALLNLLEHGRNKNINWILLFFEEGPLVNVVRELGLQTAVISAGRLREPTHLFQTIRHIVHIARRNQVQVVFSWMSKAHLYAGPAAQIAGLPAIWFQHGMGSGWDWMTQMITCLPAQGVLACSKFVAQQQAALLPRRKVRVVYPGVDLSRFSPHCLPAPMETRLQLGLPNAGPLIGMVGRLQSWKGMHIFIEAMAKVLQAHPNASGVIVGGEHSGEPKYPAFLEQRISALGLFGRRRLVGMQSNVPHWMQAMDIIVHASKAEPFGIVVLEAMALGKPVIAGAQGGPSEIITPGENGLLTSYGDTEALISAIVHDLDNPAFAYKIGQAARQRALEFSTERFASNVIESLQTLLHADVPHT